MDVVKCSPGLLDDEFLSLAVAASSDGVTMLALDGTLMAVNAAGAALMRADGPERLIGRNWIDLWPAEERAAIRQAVQSAAQGIPSTVQGFCPTADGRPKWWRTTVMAAPAPDGAAARLLVMSRDITEQHEAGRALDRSVRLYQALVEVSSEIVWHFDAASGTTDRRGYVDFTGGRDVPGDDYGWLALIHPDDVEHAKREAELSAETSAPVIVEYRLPHKSGEWRWVEDRGVAIHGQDGVVTDWIGMITDIHDRKIAEQALQKSAEHFRLAIDATALGTWDVNLTTGEREWSPEFYDLLGIERTCPPARELFLSKIDPDDRERVDRELTGADAPSDSPNVSIFRLWPARGVERWMEAHGRTFFGPDGKPARRVGTLRNITDRRLAEQKVWMAAHTDALTGVANRALFQTRLDQAVADATANRTCVGLIVIDVDRFKDVNDVLGHDAGDTLLRSVAERLRDHFPAAATVARLGGDEFGVIVPAGSMSDIAALPRTLLGVLKRPVAYAGREFDCSVSIGWSVYPDHDPAASVLLKNADIALYEAKAGGRGHARAFVPAMRDEMERRVNVLRRAKDALIRDSVFPFYQPKMAIASGTIVGFEALLRWTDDAGLRTPGEIHEALDDPELSIKLGDRMLERVVADMRTWSADGIPFGHVALNVAAPQFYGRSFAARVLETLEAARLTPQQLEIEVTERVLLDNGMEVIGKALRVLATAGVAISLDDFGTGYASLTHLKTFPVSWLKIDRSFISTIERDKDSAAIVTAVTHLAHNIGIKVVAEGIETASQLDQVTRIGCDVGQGYLMAKPMAGSRVPFLLAHWSRPPIARNSSDLAARQAAEPRWAVP